MIRLTDEEIQAIHDSLVGQYAPITIEMQVAQAQLKNVAEWFEEKCYDHAPALPRVKRKRCARCWQALLDEVK